MGNINTILTAILCAAAPIASAGGSGIKTEQTQSTLKLGKETVSTVREAYQKGEYSEFFSEMDASYEGADIRDLIQMRQKNVPVDFQEKWEKKVADLQKEKNKELLSAVSDRDDSIFAQKVRSLAAPLSTPEQEKAISKLHSLILMAPNKGANADENTLIDIDLEYEYKLTNTKSHPHQLALRMEKMDKMVAASKSFKDPSLKQAVGLAAANLDDRLARNLDGADLNTLVKSKAKPANETEEQVYQILSSYQEQFSDLLKELGKA